MTIAPAAVPHTYEHTRVVEDTGLIALAYIRDPATADDTAAVADTVHRLVRGEAVEGAALIAAARRDTAGRWHVDGRPSTADDGAHTERSARRTLVRIARAYYGDL